MIFNTAWFILFSALLIPLYLFACPARLRPTALLGMSVAFHAHFAGAAGMAPVIVIALLTFALGILIDRRPVGDRTRKHLYLVGLAIPVLTLCVYKYSGLLASAFSNNANVFAGISIPLAISFFTFEFVHYLTDVYKGQRAIRSPLQFALFAIFFPSLVSGPIKRFEEFVPQIARGIARPSGDILMRGLIQTAIGFAKKLIVADNATLGISILEARPEHDALSVMALVTLLSIRILFDFSGYSDIAIGIARMTGINLPANFKYPYASLSIADFWRRWHISLSSWIRDYIYIPLGGGRQGVLRKSCNVLIAMFICGMWHGPAWHFGVWGIYHGVGLGAHSWWQRHTSLNALRGTLVYRCAALLVTNVFVAFGWLLFFYPIARVMTLVQELLNVD